MNSEGLLRSLSRGVFLTLAAAVSPTVDGIPDQRPGKETNH
jgi:hypothetical protein